MSQRGDVDWHARTRPGRRDVDAGGHTVHAIDLGDGPPVVLVHGFADSTYCWHRNDQALRDAGLRTVMMDQPGLGRSAPTGRGFAIEHQAEAILRATDTLGLDRFSLMGHSLGGGITLYLSHHHPDRVQRAVVIAPVCYPPPRRPALAYPGVPLLARHMPRRALIRGGLRGACGHPRHITRALLDEYTAAAKRPDFLQSLTGLARQYFSEAYHQMCGNHAALRVPLLILWGERDAWLPAGYGERLHGEVPGAELHLLDAGHMAHQERADRVNALLASFLTQ